MGTGNYFTVPGAYMPAEKFIEEGKIALAEFSDKRTIEEWEALYAKKRGNASFVKGYIAKRNRAKLDNADIFWTICEYQEREKFDGYHVLERVIRL